MQDAYFNSDDLLDVIRYYVVEQNFFI